MYRRIFAWHPVIGYRFIPGLNARIPHEGGGYRVRTNGAGFRCEHEVTPEKPPGVRRVLLFGDSFTAGDGVDNADRFGDRLERAVPNIQVLNFGLPNSGTDQQYLAFRELCRDLDYDVLMVCPLVENIRRIEHAYRPIYSNDARAEAYLPKPYFEIDGDDLVLHHVPVPKGTIDPADLPADADGRVDTNGRFPTLRRLVQQRAPGVKPLLQRVLRYDPVPAYRSADSRGWRLMSGILRMWFEEAGRPVLLCPLPLHQHVEGTAPSQHYRQRFGELARDTSAVLCDPLPRFHSEPQDVRRRCRFPLDPHPTPLGHEILTDALAPCLARLCIELERTK